MKTQHFKAIITNEDKENIVFDYVPKEFPVVATSVAKGFISAQEGESSDFLISDINSEQAGIRQELKKQNETKIQELALEKLKEVEERAYQEAYELGLIEGSEKAFQEKQGEIQDRIQKLDSLLNTFEDLKQMILKENEVIFMKMIMSIAEKVSFVEISTKKEVILKVLNTIVKDIQSDEGMKLRLNAEDYLFVTQVLEKEGKDYEHLQNVKLDVDDEVVGGGCILETNFGTIDASVEERVAKVWERLLGKVPRIINHNIELDISGFNKKMEALNAEVEKTVLEDSLETQPVDESPSKITEGDIEEQSKGTTPDTDTDDEGDES